jgi:hypothetical protein
MVKTMVRLVQLIGMFMKNPMQAVLEIFLLAVGVPCIIVLIAPSHAHRDDLRGTHCSTNFPACDPIMYCCYSYICGRCGRGSLLEWYDTCVETENHPEAWWYNTAFEYYNVNLRALLSFSTCSNGYSPEHILYQEKRVSECSVSGEYAHARLSQVDIDILLQLRLVSDCYPTKRNREGR